MKGWEKYLGPFVIVTVIYAAGFYVGQLQLANEYGLRPYIQAVELLKKEYVDPNKLDAEKMAHGAIRGMVASVGDRHTNFKEGYTAGTGKYAGIGTSIEKVGDWVVIDSVFFKSPAALAGILPGDTFIYINGKSAKGMSSEDVSELVRGGPDTDVTVTLARGCDKAGNLKTLTLVRKVIDRSAIQWEMLGGNIAYVVLLSFDSDSEIDKTLEEVRKAGPKGIVFDVRNDPGGYINTAINVSSWFLNRNSLVATETAGRSKGNQWRTGRKDGPFAPIPTVILINGSSASASEMFAGAMRDQRKTKLIGEKSFGKGSMQKTMSLVDNTLLTMTVARWVNPSGREVNGNGLEPDIRASFPDPPVGWGSHILGVAGKDPQLDTAIKAIKEMLDNK